MIVHNIIMSNKKIIEPLKVYLTNTVCNYPLFLHNYYYNSNVHSYYDIAQCMHTVWLLLRAMISAVIITTCIGAPVRTYTQTTNTECNRGFYREGKSRDYS